MASEMNSGENQMFLSDVVRADCTGLRPRCMMMMFRVLSRASHAGSRASRYSSPGYARTRVHTVWEACSHTCGNGIYVWTQDRQLLTGQNFCAAIDQQTPELWQQLPTPLSWPKTAALKVSTLVSRSLKTVLTCKCSTFDKNKQRIRQKCIVTHHFKKFYASAGVGKYGGKKDETEQFTCLLLIDLLITVMIQLSHASKRKK